LSCFDQRCYFDRGGEAELEANRQKRLYIEELKELYGVANQLAKALPQMAKLADSDDLRTGIEGQLEQAKEHVARLEKTFSALGENPNRKTEVDA
jgi:ferritin-like metal-binding protein YciE